MRRGKTDAEMPKRRGTMMEREERREKRTEIRGGDEIMKQRDNMLRKTD